MSMMKLKLLQRVRDLRGHAKELPGNQICTNKPVPIVVPAKSKGEQEAGPSPPTTNG